MSATPTVAGVLPRPVRPSWSERDTARGDITASKASIVVLYTALVTSASHLMIKPFFKL